jgi:hypothetical protein
MRSLACGLTVINNEELKAGNLKFGVVVEHKC